MTQTIVNESIAAHVGCVTGAADNIFKATCGATLKSMPDGSEQSGPLIVAVISLVGELEWSIFMGLPKETATAAAAKFAGFPIPFESADMGDAIGELTNILAGEVKAQLDAKGVKADISLPTVIRAEGIEVLVQRSGSTWKTCLDGDLGPLWLGVAAGKDAGFVS
jgi:CheY-specific phosphatase CheX